MVYSNGLRFFTLPSDAMTRRTCVNTVVWLVIPRSLTEIYHDLGGKYSYTLEMEAILSSERIINLTSHTASHFGR
jgi:hypothetical protein